MDRLLSVIDVRGKGCPLYLIEAKWALDRCSPGTAVKILATDPEFPKDFEAFCRKTGTRILDSTARNNELSFLVEKCDSEPPGP